MDKYLNIENMNIVLIRTNDRAHMEDIWKTTIIYTLISTNGINTCILDLFTFPCTVIRFQLWVMEFL